MTNEEYYDRFVRAVEALGGKVVEPRWLGRFVGHRVICAETHENTVLPGNVLKGQGICRECGTKHASALRLGSRQTGRGAVRHASKLERKYTCIGLQDNGCTAKVCYRGKRCRPCTTKYQNDRRHDIIIARNARRRIEKKDDIKRYRQERKESGVQQEQQAAYYQEHMKEIKAAALKWARENPEQARASQLRHYERGIEGMDAKDMDREVEYRKAIADDPCFYCGGPGEHDDHYQALDGKPKGSNMFFNLVRACETRARLSAVGGSGVGRRRPTRFRTMTKGRQ